MKRLILFAGLLLLVSCGTVDLFQSQQRLKSGIDRKIAAEKAAVSFAKDRTGTLSDASKGFALPDSVQSLRLALADDAARDYKSASSSGAGLTRADRISLLLASARKSHHAGREADDDLMDKVKKGGANLCQPQTGEIAPERDCQLIAMLDLITNMQESRDIIFDISIEAHLAARAGKTNNPGGKLIIKEDQLVQLTKAVTNLYVYSGLLNNHVTQNKSKADIAEFVKNWQFIYWCDAVVAMQLLDTQIAPSLSLEAVDVATNPNAAVSGGLLEVLEKADLSERDFKGVYVSYTTSLYPSLDPPDFSGHAKNICKL